jgi:hypothetical protein
LPRQLLRPRVAEAHITPNRHIRSAQNTR